jgi:transposase
MRRTYSREYKLEIVDECNAPGAACWAHARRAFYELHEANQSPIAAEALARIAALYAIESDIRGRPPDERARLRQARAGPLLEALREWLRQSLARTSKKSELAKAIGYMLTRWSAFTRYRATVVSRLTTTPPSVRCVRLLSVARIICSAAPTPAASARPPCTA